ncbi:hypothetical protein [Pricia sp.]|uniref:hypothetical protein n=1 Tax=Pricia sp. TaxID=2268138 RepID=UPI00359323E8
MSKSKYVFLASMALALGTGCEKSSSEEFVDVNGKTPGKFISSITLVSAQDTDKNEKVDFSYDAEKILSSVTDGSGTSEFVYDDKGLTEVTGDGSDDTFDVEKLYKSPYDAFETGDVVEFDDNGNPSKILFFEEEYNFGSDDYISKQYSAELTYEDTPSVYFHTLKAAGLIDVLDQVKLNFSMQPQAQEIMKARTLLPNNNISKITYKDEEGEVAFEIETFYTYDADDYPTQVTVTSKSSEETQVYKINYEYL